MQGDIGYPGTAGFPGPQGGPVSRGVEIAAIEQSLASVHLRKQSLLMALWEEHDNMQKCELFVLYTWPNFTLCLSVNIVIYIQINKKRVSPFNNILCF